MNKFIAIAFALFYLGCPTLILSQTYGDVGLSLNSPIEIQPDTDYEIGSIQIKGADQLDPTMVSLLSGLNVGDKVQFPSDKVAKAVRNLWEQELFDDVQLYITKKIERVVYLEFRLKTLPKLSKFYFTGIKKAKQDAIRELLDLKRGKVVSKNLLITSSNAIKKYFIEKGFLEADAEITSFQDSSLLDAVILKIDVNPGERLKIEEIVFKGNKSISDKKLRKVMDDTHRYRWWNIFGISKLLKEKLESDKSLIVEAYNEAGFRDMRIKSDTFYKTPENKLIIEFEIQEGRPYHYKSVSFYGNSKYSTEILQSILKIKAGDRFNSKALYSRVNGDPDGNDISSLYLNNGYLFANVIPVEVKVEKDSIDLEIRIREGKQATVRKVIVNGNERTNDHVIYREIRTRPGDLFSKSDIMRTVRELGQLGYFDPRQITPVPIPDPITGTVDLEYTVVEQSTSQLELQGGWGRFTVVGTLGLNFNNFSARNIFNKRAWQPLPTGDGQNITIRAQTNGTFYSSYNFSFTEPWWGGKKPNSVTFSAYHNTMNYSGQQTVDSLAQKIGITGVTLGQARRLKWPDDYFTLFQSFEYRRFNINNYPLVGASFTNGIANSVAYTFNLRRDNRDLPIFPTRGSSIGFTLEATPPVSLLDGRDYSKLSPTEKFRFIEYHKWKFTGDYYAQIAKNFVIKSYSEFGFLGSYNKDYGLPPFERYYLGGDGLQNFVLDGREVIGLRGYTNFSLTPDGGGALYNKFTTELRYLLSPNPQAQIFVLAFAEAGNNYDNFADYRPFELKRSNGVGLRIFMPMFGLLGVDLAYGYDNLPGTSGPSGWQTHFVLGQQF
ncbi:MAG: outer membrane protein assembly factor BamA [Schleiferiaceae bacterium]|nr:MAG: outer membrane protein assembly factor BamA [Owenweeksia sp. TMED14]|tara:strand:+ start:13945 stop:16443 length:2499 start_codon:yes stop_codon:yes gene_type:complete